MGIYISEGSVFKKREVDITNVNLIIQVEFYHQNKNIFIKK